MPTPAAHDDPSAHYFPIRWLRHRWALILQFCDSASTYEDPLYALYGEIFSTLSMLVVPRGASSREPTPTNSLYFSHPQCHLVQKHKPASGRVMYTIPDFAFLYVKIAQTTDGDFKVEAESVAFLAEIKRLYDDVLQTQLSLVHSPENSLASVATFKRSIRQLLLQVFCGWHVFDQSHIYIKFICGTYFTLVNFTRPLQLHPLPNFAASTGEKRKYNDLVNAISATTDIPDADIIQWVPEDSVEIIYWNKPVSDNIRNPELYLSALFRSGMKLCLEGTDSQPSGLFDVTEVEQDAPSDVASGESVVSDWYLHVQQQLLRTPPRNNNSVPEEGDTSSPEQDYSPYKGRAVEVVQSDKVLRSSAKDIMRDLKL